ncbi:hypothetical protein [Paraferrimonas sedimenticola]|uniref:DUF4878 domain-containing protein n=1 Tax=Paraferrimonas sedimenticola TaxID=375674 RepID=A0AA37RU30_9GAMM|nr:hypothetical protein [Paraferrimonas sedimenticola]GLP94814.1 hypothetical protein GCM10007895_01200 [Paraferrimonas sedimenticola]
MRLLLLLVALLSLGCQPKDPRAEMTPEQVAIAFLDAIYVQQNTQLASEFVSDELKELLAHYRLPSSVQRHVLGLRMNNAELMIGDVGIDFFRLSDKDIQVTVKLEGDLDFERRLDDRTLELNRINGYWYVTKVEMDIHDING